MIVPEQSSVSEHVLCRGWAGLSVAPFIFSASFSNSLHPPLCKNVRCSEGGNFAMALMLL